MKREAKAVFEVMANLAGAIEAIPSMMENVDDDAPMGHVSKQMWALMEMEFRLGVRTEMMTMSTPRQKTLWVDPK